MKSGLERVILFALAFLFTLIVFLLDYNSGSEYHVSVLYVLIILYSWLLPGRYSVMIASAICMVLTFFVAIEKNHVDGESAIIINAAFSSVAIWVAMFLTTLSRRGYEQLKITISGLDKTVAKRTTALRAKLIDTEIQNKLIAAKNRENLTLNRKLSEESALAETNKRRFQNLMKEAPTGILIIRSDGTILDLNEFVESRMAIDASVPNQSILTLIHHEDRSNFEAKLSRFYENLPLEKRCSVEVRLLSKNQGSFPAEVSFACLETDKMDETIVTVFDLTERKAQEELKLRTASVEIRNKEIENMAYLASHDLRQPLSSIAGLAELLDDMIGTENEIKPFIQHIIGATERMNELITQLLDLSQLGSSERADKVSLNELTQEVLDDLNSLIKRSDAHITKDDLPPAENASPFELRILMQNLINNAIKFTPEDRNPVVHIGHRTDENGSFYFVSDNGIGISQQDQNEIFGMFKRLHQKHEYEGTGIGLAYCKKIVEAHSGKLLLKSETGKGSTFYFSLNSDYTLSASLEKSTNFNT